MSCVYVCVWDEFVFKNDNFMMKGIKKSKFVLVSYIYIIIQMNGLFK